jgi:hypothetical protein
MPTVVLDETGLMRPKEALMFDHPKLPDAFKSVLS